MPAASAAVIDNVMAPSFNVEALTDTVAAALGVTDADDDVTVVPPSSSEAVNVSAEFAPPGKVTEIVAPEAVAVLT